MRYFVTGHEMLLYLSGDREEHKEECCFELPDFESKEEAVFRFFANGYRREHGTEPEVTGNRKLSERDIISGMGAVPTKTDLGKR